MEKENLNSDIFAKYATPEDYKQGLFIEVAGQIRKRSQKPMADDSFEDVYIPWPVESIFRNYGKDYTVGTIFKEMPRFDGETFMPSHIDFKPVIGRFINLYHPLRYQPKEGGNWPHIESLFKHIFGSQYELGLDYIELLYKKPMQRLPLILLVSKANQTGKSTFCDFLKLFFGQNATGVSREGLKNRFNSILTNKLIVYVEEKLFEKEEDSDMLKNLVTTFMTLSERKYHEREEVSFFCKFVFTTNNENNPIFINDNDTRVWAIKVPELAEGAKAPNFLEKCQEEIPYFMSFLKNRELSTEKEDRLWFKRDLIVTDAWHRIVNYCRPLLFKQTADLMLEIMDKCKVNVLRYSLTDLIILLNNEKIKVDRFELKQLLKERLNMPDPVKARYDCFIQDYSCAEGFSSKSTTGWCYEFRKEMLMKYTVR